MKKFQFRYEMQIEFSNVAQKHSFTLKCFPHSDERQEITDLQIELLPKVSYEQGVDSFGNVYIYGNCERNCAPWPTRLFTWRRVIVSNV